MQTLDAPARLARFEPGKTYRCRSLCDYDAVWLFEVTARSARRVTLRSLDNGELKHVYPRVSHDGAEEVCQPLGRYSMAPLLRASCAV